MRMRSEESWWGRSVKSPSWHTLELELSAPEISDIFSALQPRSTIIFIFSCIWTSNSLPMSTLLRIQSCARTNRRDVVSVSNVLRGLKTMSQGHDSQIPQYMNFPSTKLCYHWDTLPPTEAQLVHANGFFTKKHPKHLWSTSQFYSMEFGDSSEVCFLGRSNVSQIL